MDSDLSNADFLRMMLLIFALIAVFGFGYIWGKSDRKG